MAEQECRGDILCGCSACAEARAQFNSDLALLQQEQRDALPNIIQIGFQVEGNEKILAGLHQARDSKERVRLGFNTDEGDPMQVEGRALAVEEEGGQAVITLDLSEERG